MGPLQQEEDFNLLSSWNTNHSNDGAGVQTAGKSYYDLVSLGPAMLPFHFIDHVSKILESFSVTLQPNKYISLPLA